MLLLYHNRQFYPEMQCTSWDVMECAMALDASALYSITPWSCGTKSSQMIGEIFNKHNNKEYDWCNAASPLVRPGKWNQVLHSHSPAYFFNFLVVVVSLIERPQRLKPIECFWIPVENVTKEGRPSSHIGHQQDTFHRGLRRRHSWFLCGAHPFLLTLPYLKQKKNTKHPCSKQSQEMYLDAD